MNERALTYVLLVTLAASLVGGAGSGVLAFFTMRELSSTRVILQETKATSTLCKEALIRSDARREQMSDLLEMASGRKLIKSPPMGGN